MALEALSIELPEEMIRTIEHKMASGHYASPSAMVQDALENMRIQEESFEDWIRREALPALDALDADPSSGLTLEQAFANLDEDEEEDEINLRRAG